MMDEDFFEGAEKLLEIWLRESADPRQDLRNIERNHLDDMLNKANCKILSFFRGESIDSYILSESSLFVMRNRIVLKTCGTTPQINAISFFLELAERFCGFDVVEKVFYSRKKLMKPFLQHDIHQSFEREVEELKKVFGGGNAYTFGDMNEECWFLYMFSRTKQLNLPPEVSVDRDTTLEVLMVELSQNHEGNCRESGLIFQDAKVRVDEHFFKPCGYSANGVIDDKFYYSAHVTPQREFSYASFETNVAESIADIVHRVVDWFRPSKFIVTFFSQESHSFHRVLWGEDGLELGRNGGPLPDNPYKRCDVHCAILDEYHFSYAYYKQID